MSEVVAWEGTVDGATYRVVEYDGMAWAIEWHDDGAWQPVSYGDEADAPECAVVAAHLVGLLSGARAALRGCESALAIKASLRAPEQRRVQEALDEARKVLAEDRGKVAS